MLIPLSTDAPIYHFPFATIGLIVTNVVCFGLTAGGDVESAESWIPYSLQYGNGLHPIQWVTSNFLHAGLMHLIGNMIFLWGFGLVVEGKLGWWRFLLVYLAIGVVQCAVEQTIMLGHDPLDDHKDRIEELLEVDIDDLPPEEREEMRKEFAGSSPGSLGASSIIYGLLAIALVWAPKNEMTVILFILYRGIMFEITIMAYAIWYIGWEIVSMLFMGLEMSTELLHLMGAAVGFGVGVLLLKRGWVDCEGWDLFAVLSGDYGPYTKDLHGFKNKKKKKRKKKKRKPRKAKQVGESSDVAAEPEAAAASGPNVFTVSFPSADESMPRIARLIETGNFVEAAEKFLETRSRDPHARLEQEQCLDLANGLVKNKNWNAAVALLKEYIAKYSEAADPQRLTLGTIFLEIQRQPQRALQVVADINDSRLSAKQRKTYQQIVNLARKQIAEEQR